MTCEEGNEGGKEGGREGGREGGVREGCGTRIPQILLFGLLSLTAEWLFGIWQRTKDKTYSYAHAGASHGRRKERTHLLPPSLPPFHQPHTRLTFLTGAAVLGVKDAKGRVVPLLLISLARSVALVLEESPPPSLPPSPPSLPPITHKTYLLDRRRLVGGKGCQGLCGAIAVDFLGQVRGLGLKGGLVVVEDDGAAAAVRHLVMLVLLFLLWVGGRAGTIKFV